MSSYRVLPHNKPMRGKVYPKLGFGFLLEEIRLGLTFADIALKAKHDDCDKIERNTAHARQAYEAVLRFQPRIDLNESEKFTIEGGLEELKGALRQLGELV